MKKSDWNFGIAYLEKCEVGCWIEHDKRAVEVVDMSGGHYLLFDEKREVVGLTDDVLEAMAHLKG